MTGFGKFALYKISVIERDTIVVVRRSRDSDNYKITIDIRIRYNQYRSALAAFSLRKRKQCLNYMSGIKAARKACHHLYPKLYQRWKTLSTSCRA